MIATASYFSDVLCVWAYVAQIRLDTLQRKFGDKVRVQYHFLPLFGDVAAHIDASWLEKGGAPVFNARGLTKVYRTGEVEVHALRGVDLEVYRGEFIVLLGASGSGKQRC